MGCDTKTANYFFKEGYKLYLACLFLLLFFACFTLNVVKGTGEIFDIILTSFMYATLVCGCFGMIIMLLK